MTVNPLLFILLLIGLCVGAPGVLKFFMVCCLLGAAAVVSVPALGGAPITPGVFALPLLLLWALRAHGLPALRAGLQAQQPGRWLLLLTAWGAASAAVLPRLLAGATDVFTTNRSDALSLGVLRMGLQPVSTNLTQAAYLIAGLATFVAVRALLSAPGGMQRFGAAVRLLAWANLAAVVLNLAETYLHLPSLLDLVRNAGYATMVGGDIGGLQRISGTFPEASAWAFFTMPLFAFAASLWADRCQPRSTGLLAGLTLAALLFSTSSTAYSALALYLGGLAVLALLRLVSTAGHYRIGPLAPVLWGAAVVSCLVLLLLPEAGSVIATYFDQTMLRKLQSASGVERSSWNLQAWHNFVDSGGLGIGLGSGRASSFPMVLLSNLGVLGVLLFGLFVAALHRSRRAAPAPEQAIRRAALRAVWAALITASVSGSIFDLGLMFYTLAAGAAGPLLAAAARPQTSAARARTGAAA